MAGSVQGWPKFAILGILLATGLVVATLFVRRSPPMVELDVDYGHSQRLDIYRPKQGQGLRPGVLLIHGGGWVEGDKSGERELAEGLASAGYVAIAVGYRLAKDDASRHPSQVEDVRRAVRWVRANAGYLGLDPNRLGAYGLSAGGHLVAMLGTTDITKDDDPALNGQSSRVTCVVDCCGPTDFTDESSPPLGPRAIWMADNLFGRPRDQVPEASREASPVTHVDAKSAPTLILHGTADDVVPIDQSQRFRTALDRAGVEVRMVSMEGEGHVFAGPGARDRMYREMMAFLREHLRP